MKNNVYFLDTNLSLLAEIHIVSFHLRQLVETYGKTKVAAALKSKETNVILDRHVFNLTQTYGFTYTQRIFNHFFVTKKVG